MQNNSGRLQSPQYSNSFSFENNGTESLAQTRGIISQLKISFLNNCARVLRRTCFSNTVFLRFIREELQLILVSGILNTSYKPPPRHSQFVVSGRSVIFSKWHYTDYLAMALSTILVEVIALLSTVAFTGESETIATTVHIYCIQNVLQLAVNVKTALPPIVSLPAHIDCETRGGCGNDRPKRPTFRLLPSYSTMLVCVDLWSQINHKGIKNYF